MTVQPDNLQVQVRHRRGIWGLLRGENKRKAVSRATQRLNADGYRVVQVIDDEWGFIQRLWNWLVSTCSLGILGTKPAGLIIAERQVKE